MRYGRIIAVIIILVGAYYGYKYIKAEQDAKAKTDLNKYAVAIAEVAYAAERYRAYPDSFLIARDSILKKQNLTIDSIRLLQENMAEEYDNWVELWKQTSEITDSLVDAKLDPLKADSLSDSISIE